MGEGVFVGLFALHALLGGQVHNFDGRSGFVDREAKLHKADGLPAFGEASLHSRATSWWPACLCKGSKRVSLTGRAAVIQKAGLSQHLDPSTGTSFISFVKAAGVITQESR